jgi:hypothetical protein
MLSSVRVAAFERDRHLDVRGLWKKIERQHQPGLEARAQQRGEIASQASRTAGKVKNTRNPGLTRQPGDGLGLQARPRRVGVDSDFASFGDPSAKLWQAV